jgi:hypothetical protein
VSKRAKSEAFMVDYCDGDSEDEYQWLEGPHEPQHTTVADLLDRRRSQSRRSRRQQGHTTLRCDQRGLDDPNGKREASPGIPPKPREPNMVEPEEEDDHEDNEEGVDLTIVDIHILGLFQQIERFQKFLMDPTEEKEAVIRTHDEYLRLSEAGMSSQEREQIKSFKRIIDYERCISILNYENWSTLTDEEKQEYAKNTDPNHQHKMTREEVAHHAEHGRKLVEKWEIDTREAMGSSPKRDIDLEDNDVDRKDDKDTTPKDKDEDGNDDDTEDEEKTLNDMDDGQRLRTRKDEDDDDVNGTVLMTQRDDVEECLPLHDMSCVGIDTCSAKSISCDMDDFLALAWTPGESVLEELRGVGGSSKVAGKGVMVFYVKDIDGKTKALIEPKGLYLENPSAKFRIVGQQRMKSKGLNLVQDYDDEGTDILKCKRSGGVLPLEEGDGLLLLRTFKYQPNEELKTKLNSYAEKLVEHNSFLPHLVDLDSEPDGSSTVLILNEAKLKTEEYERLLHWRFGHTNSKVLQAMGLIEKSHLNEDCYCCNKAKFKRAPFPKNEGSFVAIAEPFWRIYCDGYGGQRSLGSRSYGGAKGGIVFVCPVSGSIIVKLYALMKDFPAILYQVLQQIESQGFVCREVLVDTFVVNLSEAAEEVAAIFKARIIPISAGTPQELAYAERAVRSIGEKSRAMLLGAPHLPNSMWGMADIHAGNVIDVLPRVERGNKSPYEFRRNKKPNVDHLFLKVFDCPCQYSPMDGPEHKRASKTEWGYYVGMQ